MDVLAKVRALLALAASQNIDEARNAALAAAKLIREHNIILTLPAASIGVSFPAPKVSKMRIRVREQPRPPVEPDDEWRKMKAKFDGYCKWCSKSIRKNESIYWSKENGAYHPNCYVKSGAA